MDYYCLRSFGAEVTMKTRLTVKVNPLHWDLFNAAVKAAGLRRDAFLNRALPAEVDMLDLVPSNTEAGERYLKKLKSAVKNYEKQVSLTLDADLALRINNTCKKKRVLRDPFLSTAISFLTSRLIMPAMVIKDPRGTLGISDSGLHERISEYLSEEEAEELSDDMLYENELIFPEERIAAIQEAFDNINADLKRSIKDIANGGAAEINET